MPNSMYIQLRQWLQPYWKPNSTTQPKPKKQGKKQMLQPVPTQNPRRKKQNVVQQATYQIKNITTPWKNPADSPKPSTNQMLCFHNKTLHQIVANIQPNTGFRYKGRNDTARKNLKTILYPNLDGPYDRTHLIPIGYHGAEKHPMLVVGWSPTENQGPMNNFEQKIKQLPIPIYWEVTIKRTNDGAILTYIIWDQKTLKPIDKLTSVCNAKFVWN